MTSKADPTITVINREQSVGKFETILLMGFAYVLTFEIWIVASFCALYLYYHNISLIFILFGAIFALPIILLLMFVVYIFPSIGSRSAVALVTLSSVPVIVWILFEFLFQYSQNYTSFALFLDLGFLSRVGLAAAISLTATVIFLIARKSKQQD